ncbi:hypothetical protein BJV82DRAFT_576835 [Fennellomyces sp. T-0311]|nr:hypothetical protein BJV82DRAFT_576835 [Fennellomyces sp. T-0311]
MDYFLNWNFCERLPNLRHISIRNPLGNSDHLRSIAQNVGIFCLKLKTFRYGASRENMFCNENGVMSIVEDAQEEQEEGIREIVVRVPPRNRQVNMTNAMIVSSLLLERKKCSLLTVLVLQMEMLGATELQTLTNLHLPGLKDFQLHQYYCGESHKIRPEHFAPISRNFPALENIVLNNVQSTNDAIFELSKARQLRRAHLRVIDVPDLGAGFVPQTNAPLNQTRPRRAPVTQYTGTQPAEARHISALQMTAGADLLTYPPAHSAYLARYYDTSLKVYTKFINNFTMLTEVSLYGPTVQDADLYSLMANNRNLSTVNLIYCKSLTSNGIISAFNYVGSGTSPNIHQITLACMWRATEAAVLALVSSLARIPSLRKLIMIELQNQGSESGITTSLKYDPSRKVTLEVYCLDTLINPEGILHVCLPGQQTVVTRSVPSVSIVKHIADFL